MNTNFFNNVDEVKLLIIIWIFVLLAIWELAWKGWALWKAGRNNHAGWFIVLFIFNTIGILPILYIYVFSKRGKDI